MAKVQLLTPRQQDRRHRILSTARDMLTELGYEGMVMSQVAARADVSPTTLYNLYNTKDELLLEALQELIQEAARMTTAEIDKPGYEFILRHLHHSAIQSQEGPAYAEAIAQAVFRAKPGDALIELLLAGLSRNILTSLLVMKSNKELKSPVNAEELSKLMAGVFWSTFLLWTKGLIRLPDMERHLLRCFLSMLIPATRGRARKDLESRYNQLDSKG